MSFLDETQADFEAGTSEGVVVEAGQVRLAAEASGAFESRVFDAGLDASWQTLSWVPEAPYGKALPDNGATEVGYLSDGLDMSGNILLMHFDHDAVQGVDAVIPDGSGLGNDGIVLGGSIASTSGVFSTAADDTTQSYVSIPISPEGDFQLGTDDFTFSVWFNFTGDCTENNVFMGAENAPGHDGLAHIWLGCSDSSSACADDGQVRVAGTLTATQTGEDDIRYCSQSAVDDGQWHHAVLVKSGHRSSSILLYLDGVLEFNGGGSFNGPIDFPDLPDFVIGGFSGGTFPTSGRFDEVGVWRRAMSEAEAVALFRRGATRMGLQVRSCLEPDCADEPPFLGGPQLESDREFEDLPTALQPGTPASVEGLTGRYVQYRATFGSAGPSVVLDRIALLGASG